MKRKVLLSSGETTEWDDELETWEELDTFLYRRLGISLVRVIEDQKTEGSKDDDSDTV